MITARSYAERGRRRAEQLGIPLDRLPPGQSPTLKFPVLQIWRTPPVRTSTFELEVTGLVEHELRIDWEQLQALPQTRQTSDLHCVTRWSKFDTEWVGVRARDILALARPQATATHVLVRSSDGYETNLPLEALLDDDVLVAHTFDGAPLDADHGGPARLLVPRRYLWKSAKWVAGLDLRDHDEPGTWERNGYHNDGDPWAEQRRAGRH